MRPWHLCPTILLATSVASANTYTVHNDNDVGWQTLRWAIEKANSHVGPDRILFAPQLKGAIILVFSPLPTLTDDRTAINGDIDGDGRPDVAVSGRKALPATGGPGPVSGLVIEGHGCTVRGLAIVAFSGDGISLSSTRNCRVMGCYLGVSLKGTSAGALGRLGINVWKSDRNIIGGAQPKDRNVFGPNKTQGYGAVLAYSSSENLILGNYFGLAPDGASVLGGVQYGVFVNGLGGPADANVIGGEDSGAGNAFAGCQWGVMAEGATHTEILGNLFGLKADGDTSAPTNTAVHLGAGTTDTQIGGTAPGARNVFTSPSGYSAIEIRGLGTADNVIQGNYFGTNRDGTQQRQLGIGIHIWYDAGWQRIAGNHFAGLNPNGPCDAIDIWGPGSALIQSNSFGLLPLGGAATGTTHGVFVHSGGNARLLDNTITNTSGRAVWVKGATSQAFVFGNVFRHCHIAVAITNDATCRLGNLGNVNNHDDGGNQFKPSNTWTIWNTTPSIVKAEGNDFDTTSMSAIDAGIYDALDCSQAGRVDFVPLMGNVIPTGGSSPAVALTRAVAMPTNGGAEIAFTLSAPVDISVTVLNIAGRPVATVARDLAAEAGTRRLVWSGKTLNGTPAPAGTYLVRVTAHGPDVAQASALCTLRLER